MIRLLSLAFRRSISLRVRPDATPDVLAAGRAVVSDDGVKTQLTLSWARGAVAPLELNPIRAIMLAGRLIEAALPKLKNG